MPTKGTLLVFSEVCEEVGGFKVQPGLCEVPDNLVEAFIGTGKAKRPAESDIDPGPPEKHIETATRKPAKRKAVKKTAAATSAKKPPEDKAATHANKQLGTNEG